jgi:hypothetical protein
MKLKRFNTMRQLTRQPMLCAFALAALSLSGCTAQAQDPQAQVPQDAPAAAAVAAPVTLLKTPNDGIQPQAVMDSKGALHLIYFKGKSMAGDIFYVRSTDGGKSFSPPLRVNSQADSAIAMGTIRGAQIALGKEGRVHIAWNGSGAAQPKGVNGAPMLYTRLNDAGDGFELQRSVMTWAGTLDGGGALAADDKGNVFVTWHSGPAGKDETERAVYLARSTDNGATFEREKKISVRPTGACACCQVRALVDAKGTLTILYRAAGKNVDRDTTLLVSADGGNTFQSSLVQPWKIEACPMSTYALLESGGSVRAAWETEEQIYSAAIDPASAKFSPPIPAPGQGNNRKHPTLAVNGEGKMLLAWTEGTGWNRGGSLVWQLYDAKGQLTNVKGRSPGVLTWGLLSAITLPDGGFLLLH